MVRTGANGSKTRTHTDLKFGAPADGAPSWRAEALSPYRVGYHKRKNANPSNRNLLEGQSKVAIVIAPAGHATVRAYLRAQEARFFQAKNNFLQENRRLSLRLARIPVASYMWLPIPG
jgi:hypothetical protein